MINDPDCPTDVKHRDLEAAQIKKVNRLDSDITLHETIRNAK